MCAGKPIRLETARCHLSDVPLPKDMARIMLDLYKTYDVWSERAKLLHRQMVSKVKSPNWPTATNAVGGKDLLKLLQTMPGAGDSRCPVCRAALAAPGVEALGSKTCPRCGAELWVLVGSAGPLFFPRQPGQSSYGFLAALAGPLSNLPADEMEAALRGMDSLDLVELILEVEEALKSACGSDRGGG